MELPVQIPCYFESLVVDVDFVELFVEVFFGYLQVLAALLDDHDDLICFRSFVTELFGLQDLAFEFREDDDACFDEYLYSFD